MRFLRRKEEEELVCTNCGERVAAGATECVMCGRQFSHPAGVQETEPVGVTTEDRGS